MTAIQELWNKGRLDAIAECKKRSECGFVRGSRDCGLGHAAESGMIGEKTYYTGVPSKKEIKRYIAACEDIAVEDVLTTPWKYEYFLEGNTIQAMSFYEYVQYGDEDCIDLREYWEVIIEPYMLERGR